MVALILIISIFTSRKIFYEYLLTCYSQKELDSLCEYCNSPEYWDRQTWVNSADPDQMLQNVMSDQNLHYFPLNHQFLDTSTTKKYGLFQILGQLR